MLYGAVLEKGWPQGFTTAEAEEASMSLIAGQGGKL
jgi:hypothetical protein